MLETTSKAEKEQALQAQEIAHLKATDIELRQRETELNDQLKLATQTSLEERKEREDSL